MRGARRLGGIGIEFGEKRAMRAPGTSDASVRYMARRTPALFACFLTISACSQAPSAPRTAASPPTSEGQAAPPVETSTTGRAQSARPKTQEEAHRLAVATAACWLGGQWSDAEGAADPTDRAAESERRCHDLVRRIYGSDDPVHYERLRALEPTEVSEVIARIQAVAGTDEVDAPREHDIATMLQGVANAEQEMALARRAGDKVKFDVMVDRPRMKLTADEEAAVAPLRDGRAFDALLNVEAGDLTHEARAVALLIAEDRMKTANGLPKHLKVFAVEQPFFSVFRVPAPEVSADAKPLKGGVWLQYLTTVAKAAGHPVPSSLQSLRDQELSAWCGTLTGLADRLRLESDQVSHATDMKRVLVAVVRRIDSECQMPQPGVDGPAQPAPPERSNPNLETTEKSP